MDMWIVLLANIKKKKGIFIGIVLLTAIIVSSMMTMFGVRDNNTAGIKNAFEEGERGNTLIYIREDRLTQEVKDAVEGHQLVESVRYYDAVETNGVWSGEHKDGNSYFIQEMRSDIFVFNEALDGFEQTLPELKTGEVYVPLGVKSVLHCEVGDRITFATISGKYEYTIKGFVLEPHNGSSVIGWKNVFINQKDFAAMRTAAKEKGTEEITACVTCVEVYKKEACNLSDAKFQQKLNLDTNIVSLSGGAITRETSERYTGLFIEFVTNVLLVFVGMLFVIVLIAMGNSITTQIETDYKDLGILKSCGYTKTRIRILLVLQYIIAEVIGTVIGILAARPIERFLNKRFQTMTGILPTDRIPILKTLVGIGLILLISALLIVVKTGKIGKLSPVKAIAGGAEDVYFRSRLQLPIYPKCISVSLTCRQFTSNQKRYVGTVMVVAILTFFMVTVNLMSNLLTSRTALESMGMELADVEIYYNYNNEGMSAEVVEAVEDYILGHYDTEKMYSTAKGYVSINGENVYCTIYRHPEDIGGIIKGRAPIYENEVLITEMVAEELGVHMGDEVTVAKNELNGQYIVSGIYQCINDSGMAFAMNYEGAQKIAEINVSYTGIRLSDPSQKEQIVSELQAEFQDLVFVESFSLEEDGVDDVMELAVNSVKIIIYAMSVVFAFVVVQMLCGKTFARERTDIGIYKALGFTVRRLRIQFAGRFLIVALIGAAIGMVMSVIFSARLLNLVLSIIGLVKVSTEYNFITVVLPILLVGVSFFIFAYFTSRKIKKVKTRELITE